MGLVSQNELQAERIHYEIIAHLVPNNRFNAIKYLYDRLNIIDAKAQGLMTRNGLLLTTVSIVASNQIRQGSVFLFDFQWQFTFGVAFFLLICSTLATLGIMFLRFDRITLLPPELAQPPGAPQPPNPMTRHLQQLIEELEATEHAAALPHSKRLARRSLEDYEQAFFNITIKRQKFLRFAQGCTVVATILFFIVIGKIFIHAAALDQ